MPLEIRYFVLNPKGTEAEALWQWVDYALTKSLEEKT